MQRIICIGGVFWESLFQVDSLPAGGVKLIPRAGRQHASGMAPAAAVTLARMGVEVSLFSRVGDDPAGHSTCVDLRNAGVDVSGVQVCAGHATPFSSVLVDARGERLVVPCLEAALYRGSQGLALDRVGEAATVLADVRWVDGAQALLQRARALGVPTVLDADVAPIPALWRLMPLADHLLLSEDALRALEPDAGEVEALQRLADGLPSARVLGVTLGARGALLIDRDAQDAGPVHVPGLSVPVVDTLNAGDVWHGAYAWGLARGLDLRERVRWAHAMAALKCTRPWGRQGIPCIDELRDFLTAMGDPP
jgi:sulfofructose kinase